MNDDEMCSNPEVVWTQFGDGRSLGQLPVFHDVKKDKIQENLTYLETLTAVGTVQEERR